MPQIISEYDPELSQLDHIRRLLKENITGKNSTGVGYFPERAVYEMLLDAYFRNVPLDVLRALVPESTSWMKIWCCQVHNRGKFGVVKCIIANLMSNRQVPDAPGEDEKC